MSAFSLTADRTALLKAVTAAARAVERRTTIPIIATVKLEVADDKVAVTGTNLEQEVRAEAEAQGQGSACIPAQRLRDMLRAMVAETVTMTGDGDGKVRLTAPDIEVTFLTLPASDFPSIATSVERWSIALPDGVTAFLIGGVVDTISAEETRYYLNGVCFSVEGGVAHAVSTDGHRLMCRSTKLEGGAAEVAQHIIPHAAVKMLLPQVGRGEATMTAVSERAIDIVGGGVRLRTKTIDGTYPEWRRVVPSDDDAKVIELDVAGFRRSLALAKANSGERGRAVKLAAVEDGIRLTSDNPDSGSVSARLACSCAGFVPDFGVNAIYLDGLARSVEKLGSRTVRLHVTSPGAPIKVMPDLAIAGALSVLMPMRV